MAMPKKNGQHVTRVSVVDNSGGPGNGSVLGSFDLDLESGERAGEQAGALAPALPRLRTHEEMFPRDPHDPHPPEYLPYCRNPTIVVRVDGRYGVARAMRSNEARRRWEEGYVAGPDSSRSSGFVHLPNTFATRSEAERRAWALARELGEGLEDWP